MMTLLMTMIGFFTVMNTFMVFHIATVLRDFLAHYDSKQS